MNVSHKLIHAHLVSGQIKADAEISLKIDQTLTQDASGTMVVLELEAMGVRTSRILMTTCFCIAHVSDLESGPGGQETASAIPCTRSDSEFQEDSEFAIQAIDPGYV